MKLGSGKKRGKRERVDTFFPHLISMPGFVHFENIIYFKDLQCCANPPPKLRYTFTATPNIIMTTTRFMVPLGKTKQTNTKIGELKKLCQKKLTIYCKFINCQ